MDGISHFCEQCGCDCDCGRDADIESCHLCSECAFVEDYDGMDDWYEEYE